VHWIAITEWNWELVAEITIRFIVIRHALESNEILNWRLITFFASVN
jgi:hypothetical protein